MILALSQTLFRRRLTRAIALPLILLLLLSGVSLWQITRLLSALRLVDHTNQVISQANYTQKLLLDMETGIRGYLLAGRQEFLEPYEQANAVINSNLNQLKRLVADNPSQAQRVTQLIAQFQQWKQQIPSAIALQQSSELEPLSALERRKQSMDQMRQQIATFITTEEQLRDQRTRTAQQTTQSVILTSLFLTLGVGAVLAYFIRRQIIRVSQTYEDALLTTQVKIEEARQSAATLQRELIERQRTEIELREQEQLFRSTFNQAAVGIAHVSPNGHWLRVNQKLCEIVGYTREELLQRTFQEITYPEDLDVDLFYVRQMLRNEIQTYSMEKRYVHKDNSLVWINLTVSMVREASGQPKYFISVVKDIRDRKRIEAERQQTQEALRQSEERFRSALLNAPLGILLHTEDGEVLLVNRVWTELTGYSIREIPTVDDWLQRAYGDRQDQVRDEIARVMPLQRATPMGEYTITTAIGTTRIWDIYASPLGQVTGSKRLVVAMAIDVTERKQAEADLQKYKDIFQFAEHGLAISRGSMLERVNPAFARLHGYTVEELTGSPILNLFPPETHAETIKFIQRLNEVGHLMLESVHLRKDGTVFPVLLDITMVPDEPNLPYRIVNLFDITERKRSEVALQRSLKDLADFKFALDQSSIVAITDIQGTITYVNDKFCKLSKYSPEELIGQNHRIVNSGYHPKEFFQQMWASITNGQVWQGEIKNRAKDGTFYWVVTTIVPFLDAAGKPYQYIAVRSDITTRKVAEAELQQLNTTLEQRVNERTAQLEEINQELEAFTYSVSHDLRAPLRTMRGFATALLEDCGDHLEEFCRSYIDSIIDDAVQMNELISDLLNYSRLTRTQINLQPTALDEVVEEALKQLTAQIQEKQAQIHIVSRLPQVMAHRSTLIQVVTNLISNAIKFVEPDIQPQVDIFAQEERQNNQDWIQLWIVDNGIGIAPEHQERVFRVFERLHGAERYSGTGIGLAIVRKGIERMGGRVGVESQLGDGSRFWVALPTAVLARNKLTDDTTPPSSTH
ncbi:PAS domain S-box protein [Brasilonema sp. UFV-L1]|uniref:PAS domain S-box protein n=1 Tax=Brasilonema sp. UFV-L1 TaxID=2234130 RepID=UPI00145C9C9D|nr:PAS domain S-box protein [Brasilonema sp. UFV-L1]NMG11141.1 hypothetical protein [Brasilonema sp. UFV-L1]